LCVAATTQLVACLPGEPCGDAIRTAAATGDIIGNPGQVLGTVSLNLAESETVTGSTMSVALQSNLTPDGNALRGHIVKVRILGSEGRVFFEPPVDQLPSSVSPGPLTETMNINIDDATVLADLRAQFVAGLLLVELTTDETPVRQFIVSTEVTSVSNTFQRAICL